VADSNDWRVTITLTDPAHVDRARTSIARRELTEDVRRRLGHAVAVGAGRSEIFLYAGTEVAAIQAEEVAQAVLTEQGIQGEFTLHHWHPVEEQWEDPAIAMPRTDAEREAEHRKLLAAEAAESAATGIAQWQAKVELGSHREAVALAGRLRGEGRPVIQRRRFLVVGASNEEDAAELAEQIRQQAPPSAVVRAEHSGTQAPFLLF
jgi:hypothetical protein